MSIQANELVWRKPAEVSDAASNGGRMTSVGITSGVKNNIFPDVSQSERTLGSTKHRKIFIHVANDDDLTLLNAKAFITKPSPGDDHVAIFEGTFTDTQAGITGTEPLFGAGQLNSNVALGAGTLTVAVEDAAMAIFRPGVPIRVSNKLTVDAAGQEEYHVIAEAGVSWLGNVATLTLVGTLASAYLATNTYVSSVLEIGDTVSAATNPIVSGGGSYDYTTYPIVPDNLGSIEQNWTLTFTSTTQFSIVGDTLGSIGTGTVSSLVAPNNPNFTRPYFSINQLGWAGTQVGTTVTFTTHPAAMPIWYKRIVPAGAASLSGDKVIVAVDGESA